MSLQLVEGPPPGLPAPVRALQEALDGVDLFLAAGGDCGVGSMQVLLQARERLDGLALRSVSQVDRSGAGIAVEPAGVHRLVQQAIGCTDEAARATVKLAHRLEHDLAPVGALLREGRITRAHAGAVAHGLRGLEPDVVARSIHAVCDAAVSSDPTSLARELRERAEAMSEELAREQRRRLEARKELRLS